jgi:hypothetical protein
MMKALSFATGSVGAPSGKQLWERRGVRTNIQLLRTVEHCLRSLFLKK